MVVIFVPGFITHVERAVGSTFDAIVTSGRCARRRWHRTRSDPRCWSPRWDSHLQPNHFSVSTNIPNMQTDYPLRQFGNGVRQATILGWMDLVRESARSAPWGDLLDFDGVDALDILLSPITLAILNELRKSPTERESSGAALFKRMRALGHRLKTAIREQIAAPKSAAPGAADCLLWTRDKIHTETLHPVALALAKQGASSRILACQPAVFDDLRRRDSSAVYTVGAWPGLVRQARREGANRAKQLAGVGAWGVPDFPDKRSGDLEAVVRSTVLHLLPVVSEAIASARAAFDAFQPELLVVGNDITLEGRAGCRVAAKLGVPTATFMHGSITGDPVHGRHCADRILVFGNTARRELVRLGIHPERIVVCGAPDLDRLPRQSGQTHPLLQARMGIRPEEAWILVATSGPGNRISHQHHQQVIENLVRLGAAMPNLPIVVKLHRKDRVEYYRQRAKGSASSRLVVLPQDTPGFPTDIFEWLQGCRIVLTGASAVAIEAMLMDVPVVTMDFRDEIHQVDFIAAGATSHVCSFEALEHAVREILAAGGQSAEVKSRIRAYLEEAFYAMDGRSASRGAQALREMIEPHKIRINR